MSPTPPFDPADTLPAATGVALLAAAHALALRAPSSERAPVASASVLQARAATLVALLTGVQAFLDRGGLGAHLFVLELLTGSRTFAEDVASRPTTPDALRTLAVLRLRAAATPAQ